MDEQANRHDTGPPSGPEPTPAPVPPPPPEAWAPPVRIEPVTGTPYGLAILGAPATTSGTAVGSLVCGIASVLVAMLVTCFGLAGADDGWGLWVAGAFALLAGSLGIAAVGLGMVGVRQTRRRPAPRPPEYAHHPGRQVSAYGHHQGEQTPAYGYHPASAPSASSAPSAPSAPFPPGGPGGNGMTPGGRGMAVAGIVCGGAGLLITVCVLGLVTLLQVM